MNVYDIYTKITMKNEVSAILAVIAKDALNLEGSLGRIAKQFETINRTSLAIGGGLGIFGGAAAIDGAAKIAEHGTKLLDQQDKLQRGGVAYADVLKLQADYFEKIAKALPTSSGSEYLKTVNELRAVTGSLGGAQALAVRALQVDTLLSNSLGKESHGEYYKLLRSGEMKGIATDPKKLEEFTDAAFSYITAFGGKLTAQDFQTFARRAGAAFINADMAKSMGPMAVLMADLGGAAAGTAAMTLHQFMTGANTLSKQQGEVLVKAGLLNPGGFTTDKGGRINVKPGGMLGSTQYSGDEPGWIRDILMPHLRGLAGGDPAILESLIAKIGRNRNTQKLIEMFGMPGFQDQTTKDLGLAAQVKPIDQAYQDYITRNPEGVKKAFNSQYESMMQAIGAPVMQAALPVMKGMTDLFTTLGGFANAHPDAVANIAKGFVGLGLALIGGGGIALLAALGPVGWFATGIIGIGGAAIAYGPAIIKYTQDFSDGMRAIAASALEKVVGWITSFGDVIAKLWEKLKSLNPFSHTSYEGSGVGGGGGIVNAAWSGGGGGVLAGGSGGGDMMGAVASSPALRQYLKTGGHGMNPQTTAWCAAYVGAWLYHHGYESLKSNVATSYENYGTAVTGAVHAGDVVVLPKSTTGPGQVGGHVGIATGRVSGDSIEMIAGNTGRGVAHEWERRGSTVIRRPPQQKQEMHVHNTMYLDGNIVHKSVVRRMVAGMTHPTTAPYADGSRHWTPPDAGFLPA